METEPEVVLKSPEDLSKLRDLAKSWIELQQRSSDLKQQMADYIDKLGPLKQSIADSVKKAKLSEKTLIQLMKSNNLSSCTLTSSRAGSIALNKTVKRGNRTKESWNAGIQAFLIEYGVEATVEDVLWFVEQEQKIREIDRLTLI